MTDRDQEIRLAAFARCAQLMHDHGGAVTWDAVQEGFEFNGERVYLAGKARGIHRPRQMKRGVLSIKTTKPRKGRTARYDDSLVGDGYFSYAFQGDEPANHDNTCLREAFEDQSPLIYFYALVPGIYQVLYPCYLMEWNPRKLFCTVAIGSQFELAQSSKVRETAGQYELAQLPAAREPVSPIERRYSTIEAKVRLHQAEFRELVLSAYDRRCSVSGLPIPELLQAAHIIPDRDERGQPDITNGICLSILHHTAYDRHLLGIDPDGRIIVADSVLNQHDGPTLETTIKALHGQTIRLPRHDGDRPNRDYLAERFEAFRRVV